MEQDNSSIKKLTDKAFSRSMLISVLSMLLCIGCLCSTTWALFSADVASESNKLMSGKFGLDILITDENGGTVSLSADAGESASDVLDAGEYSVRITMTDDTTVTKGFCTLTAGSSWQTASISVDGSNPFDFTLTVSKDGTAVTFSPHWGLPASAAIAKDGVLVLPSAGGTGLSAD